VDNSTIKYIEDEDASHDGIFWDWIDMRLLVSPMNIEEARAALAGGADIIDVKNPKEGSLGANFPWAIRAVADLARGAAPVSATIGDLPFKPGTASLAALGAAVSGAEYVKAGLLGAKDRGQAVEMMEGIVRAVKEYDPKRGLWPRAIQTICGPAASLHFSCQMRQQQPGLMWSWWTLLSRTAGRHSTS